MRGGKTGGSTTRGKQQFFASFFQKRRSFLLTVLCIDRGADGRAGPGHDVVYVDAE